MIALDIHAEVEALVLRARWIRWQKRTWPDIIKHAEKIDFLYLRLVKFRPTFEERHFSFPECVIGGTP